MISRSSRATSSSTTASNLRLLCRIVDPRSRLDGAAQRGQRILDLMRDIGGEMLDRVHAPQQRAGHVAQRPREIADFVATRREIRDRHLAAMPVAHTLGGGGE